MPEPGKSDSSDQEKEQSRGAMLRSAALMSAPTILIVFPLVGFALGYLTVKLWHWPLWVPVVTLLMGFVQGMREVYGLGKKLEREDKSNPR
jgi:F0F1-type ATP synthase assembly protein I